MCYNVYNYLLKNFYFIKIIPCKKGVEEASAQIENVTLAIVSDCEKFHHFIYSEAKSRLPFELQHADELVHRAPTMEQLGRRVSECKLSLLDKGLNVNAGKSRVMVGSSDVKMIVNSGK